MNGSGTEREIICLGGERKSNHRQLWKPLKFADNALILKLVSLWCLTQYCASSAERN